MAKKKKKRRLKVGNIFITLGLLVLFSLVIIYGKNNSFNSNGVSNNKNLLKDLVEKKDSDKDKTYVATVITAGDNLIHSSVYNYAHKLANYNGYDFKPMYELIKPIVKDYDIAYYNQETILGGIELGLSDYPTFNSPYEVGDAMVDASFNLVSLATNHTLDRGELAVLNSRNYWNKQSSVLAVGSYSSDEERNEIHIEKINNITYTMLNYTYGTNGISVPSGKDYLVNIWPVTGSNPNYDVSYQNYKEVIKSDIERVRDRVDVLIVAMHWGIEYSDMPNEYQIDAAKYLESLGVDIIIGTHPHVIQPVTWINDTLVIYSLGNFASAHEVVLRMFVYQNDWKVLPMAALIAGLLSMVIRKHFFQSFEGTLMSSFAMVMVCIWNGFFNSIQVICRERDVIKREHRSGMHISSYIFSHMMYQALLCIAQVGVTVYVSTVIGVQYPAKGVVTPFFLLDFAISLFMITYASDMLSLWISALAHTTTTAMTIMPFVLIFQLVFSGAMITLPTWAEPLTNFTISNPGLKTVAALADTNNKPYASIPNMIVKMRDSEISETVTVGQIVDWLQNEDNTMISELRSKELSHVMTLNQLKNVLDGSETYNDLKKETIIDDLTVEDVAKTILESEDLASIRDLDLGLPGFKLGSLLESILSSDELKPILGKKLLKLTTVGDVVDAIEAAGLFEKYGDLEFGSVVTVGDIVDLVASNPDFQAMRDKELSFSVKVGDLLDLVGEDKVKDFLGEKAASASYVEAYDCTSDNVLVYWFSLLGFVLVFALLSTITLEFIDKDKR